MGAELVDALRRDVFDISFEHLHDGQFARLDLIDTVGTVMLILGTSLRTDPDEEFKRFTY